MNNAFVTSLFAVASSAVVAMPVINPDSVKVSQGSDRKVTVEYELREEKAIVTIDIQTNAVGGAEAGWASIGDAHLSYMFGDVNRLVSKLDGKCYAYWRPNKAWPDGGRIQNARAVVTAWATNCPPNYAVIDLQTKDVSFYVSSNAVPGGVTDVAYKTKKLVMRKIPAAGVIWNKGSTDTSVMTGWDPECEQIHPVVISYDYYMAIYELTQGQCETMGENNTSTSDQKALANAEQRPLSCVNVDDFRGIGIIDNKPSYIFAKTGHQLPDGSRPMSRMREKYGFAFDIPSSAEWEFACRAGEGARYNNGLTTMDDVGWNSENVPEKDNDGYGYPQPVGLKAPNKWGLYDMHGNVREHICESSDFVSSYWKEGDAPAVDPAVPSANPSLVVRGGSVSKDVTVADCRSSKCTHTSSISSREWYNGVRLCAPAVYAK